jgi:hypothetical protein
MEQKPVMNVLYPYMAERRRSMKKIILSIFAFILIFVSSCSHNTVNAIDEINENMNLPFPITLAEENLEYGNEYDKWEGFGGYTLNKEGLLFSVSGWPDVLDDYHVTEYRFTSNEYSVFDISVGNTIDNAVSVLKKQGYIRDKKEEAEFGGQFYTFQKNSQIKITLQVDEDDNIFEIWMEAITTNKQNVVF